MYLVYFRCFRVRRIRVPLSGYGRHKVEHISWICSYRQFYEQNSTVYEFSFFYETYAILARLWTNDIATLWRSEKSKCFMFHHETIFVQLLLQCALSAYPAACEQHFATARDGGSVGTRSTHFTRRTLCTWATPGMNLTHTRWRMFRNDVRHVLHVGMLILSLPSLYSDSIRSIQHVEWKTEGDTSHFSIFCIKINISIFE